MVLSLDYLKQAAAISAEMLAAARSEEWDNLPEMDDKRVQAIELAFEHVASVPEADQDTFIQQVEQLNEDNKVLIGLVELSKDDAQKAILQRKKGNRAIKQYQQKF